MSGVAGHGADRVLQKDQINHEQGGYYHAYHPQDADEITREMQRMLNDRYAKRGRLTGEFGEKYDDPDQSPSIRN